MTRKQLESMLVDMGFKFSNRGFMYMTDAIEIIHNSEDNREYLGSVYYTISRKRKTSITDVERNIRHSIELYYNDNSIKIPKPLKPSQNRHKLSNKEFLYRITNFIYDVNNFEDSNIQDSSKVNIDESRAIQLLAQMYLPIFDDEEKQAITKAIEALEIIKNLETKNQ